MATFTTVSISNKALVLCGASPITALTDDTANARALNAVFDISQQDFLTECRWTFSITRSSLVTNSTANLVPWNYPEEGYVYDRPAGALRVWAMSDIYAIWREEGNYIISDTAGLGVLWTWFNSEVGLWRPKAVMAFIDKLCSDVSYHVINSSRKAEMFLEKYRKSSLPLAMAEESQTGTHQQVIDDEWTSAKGHGGNPSRSYS